MITKIILKKLGKITGFILFLIISVRGAEYKVDEYTVVLAHFNGDLVNSATNEEGQIISKNKTEFVKGKNKKGIHLTEGKILKFSLSKKFNKDRATVEMWLKPDWSGNDGKRHTMFILKGPGSWNQNAIALYKNLNYEVQLVIFDQEAKPHNIRVPVNIFQKGNWVHLAVMWDNQKGIKFYVDGELKQDKSDSWKIESLYPAIYLNTWDSYKGSNYGQAVFDELRVSNKVRASN